VENWLLKSLAPDAIQSYRMASFDRAVEVANISAAGREVEIKQMVKSNGRAYLSISGALDRSLADLLAGDTPNGGVLAT
jgi:hypothetical protein